MSTKVKDVFSLPQMLVVLFTGAITWYTYIIFYADPPLDFDIKDMLFYFAPSFFFLLLWKLGKKHENIESIAIIASSPIFLVLYQVYVSLVAFFTLIVIGILLNIDSHKKISIKKQQRG